MEAGGIFCIYVIYVFQFFFVFSLSAFCLIYHPNAFPFQSSQLLSLFPHWKNSPTPLKSVFASFPLRPIHTVRRSSPIIVRRISNNTQIFCLSLVRFSASKCRGNQQNITHSTKKRRIGHSKAEGKNRGVVVMF